MRLIHHIARAWRRLSLAFAFWLGLNYSWRLAWIKAERRDA